ncbi:acyl carrier protein [Paenibacillus sp. KN14-4R]|uniref:acyl carrier protein n=1 Tax=Paenibacillus sp. KN14-4R TaxID=3445773 RepID=UPI003F9F7A02
MGLMSNDQTLKLKKLIETISPLDVEARDEMDLREDLAIDSLSVIRLILEVEEMLGRSIFHVDNINQLVKVEDLLRICAEKCQEESGIIGEEEVI